MSATWDPAVLQPFLDALRGTDIEEFHWSEGDRRIAFRRCSLHPYPPAAHGAAAADAGAGLTAAPSPERLQRAPIKSPMVGTFHRSPSSDYPPLVIKGSLVTPGQKVGVIEAMKVMKDVISPIDGRIEEILIQDGMPVEYGQELFLVES